VDLCISNSIARVGILDPGSGIPVPRNEGGIQVTNCINYTSHSIIVEQNRW